MTNMPYVQTEMGKRDAAIRLALEISTSVVEYKIEQFWELVEDCYRYLNQDYLNQDKEISND